MKPQSLAARLLALTPQGRRLFDLLASLHADVERLRGELAAAEAAPREYRRLEEKIAVLERLLAVQEAETTALREQLDPARR